MVFNNMIADIVAHKGLHPVVTEVFIRGRKHLCCICYTIILSGTKGCYTKYHTVIMNIPNRQELQQNTINHSSDTGFKDVIRLYTEIVPLRHIQL